MSTLFPGQSLLPGQTLQSDYGVYTLTMQSDGNVVLRNNESTPLWRTGTGGGQFNPRGFIMQTDGNLVLYDTSGQARWNSQTSGNPGAFLNVQADGNLVVYRAGSTGQTANGALWSSGTNVPPPLHLQTAIASGAMVNVGNAYLPNISYNLLFSADAGSSDREPYHEPGSWSAPSLVTCGETTVTVNVTFTSDWDSQGGPGWAAPQLQQAFANALQAVMQAVTNKTAYQNYSYTPSPIGDNVIDCVDPQPLDKGYYVPPEIIITAYHNGLEIGHVTVTYSTEDQSGDVCDILSKLGNVLDIFPPTAELGAIFGLTSDLHVC